MVINYDTIALGNTLGTNLQTTGNMNQTVFDSENISALNIIGLGSIQLTSSIFFWRRDYATSSFIVDHPVYCNVNSSTLSLDSGYVSGTTLMTSGTG
jgi:hypothetical protein